jgi:hypothetical protein
MGCNTFRHLLLELPAGHLACIKLPGQLIGGNFRVMADLVSQPESLCQRQVAAMENSMGSGRFFMFTAGAPPGIRLFAIAVIIVAALPANKALIPFFPCNEFKAPVFIQQDLF